MIDEVYLQREDEDVKEYITRHQYPFPIIILPDDFDFEEFKKRWSDNYISDAELIKLIED